MATNNPMQFWDEMKRFQRTFHKGVPMFIRTDKGAHEDVWPSFFDNQLRNNWREIRRKRIQIAWPNRSDHVSLFIKNVAYEDFIRPVQELLNGLITNVAMRGSKKCRGSTKTQYRGWSVISTIISSGGNGAQPISPLPRRQSTHPGPHSRPGTHTQPKSSSHAQRP